MIKVRQDMHGACDHSLLQEEGVSTGLSCPFTQFRVDTREFSPAMEQHGRR